MSNNQVVTMLWEKSNCKVIKGLFILFLCQSVIYDLNADSINLHKSGNWAEENYNDDSLKAAQGIKNDNVVKFVYKEDTAVSFNEARFYAISMLASLLTALILFYFFFKQKKKIHMQSEAALADRTKLISMLSHDLLGPLSALDQATLLVNKKKAEGDHDALLMYFNQYSKNIANLHHLASNILNYYTEKSLFQSVPSDIYSILMGVDQFVAPFAAHKNVKIETIDHTYRLELMTSKGEALAVILRNIVFNILHHTSATHIKMELWYDNNKLIISITDNAEKMPDNVYHKIMEIIQHPHKAKNSESRGMGLFLIGRYLKEIHSTFEIQKSNSGNKYNIGAGNVIFMTH